MVRVPGISHAGAVDAEHFVSLVDLAVTLLELIGLPNLEESDGRSFVPILRGEKQDGRESVVTVFHHTPGHAPIPMRGLLRGRYNYVYNAWCDGQESYTPGDPFGGLTWPAMKAAAQNDAAVNARVEFCLRRAPEELYDVQSDPNALNNLIDDAKFAEVAALMRAELLEWMRAKDDPALAEYRALTTANEMIAA